MRRLIASTLMLFLLVGISTPLALALSADPPHACCLRKKTHCHTTATELSDQRSFNGPKCPHHTCCRALSASHWARPQQSTHAAAIHEHQGALDYTNSVAYSSDLNASHAVRGPPPVPLA
jgi:hypothetical protein